MKITDIVDNAITKVNEHTANKLDTTIIHNSTSKITPVDADELALLDSAGSFGLKKLTWANLKSTLFASPALTGTPTAPTATVGDNNTSIATTAFVNAEISGDVGVANSSLVKTALNASGTAPIYACRAWVNFNGTGTVAIRASGNVSSITDTGAGDYTVNFTIAMPDVNYSISVTIPTIGNAAIGFGRATYSQLANSVRLGQITNQLGQAGDQEFIYVQTFR